VPNADGGSRMQLFHATNCSRASSQRLQGLRPLKVCSQRTNWLGTSRPSFAAANQVVRNADARDRERVVTGTLKMRDMNFRHQIAGVENTRHENARNAKVWNTCCICLSIAEQECMSRQERAPDFAANCVLVND